MVEDRNSRLDAGETWHIGVRLSKWGITNALVAIVLFLHLANVLAVWLDYRFGPSPFKWLYTELFSVSGEGKIPTWYSAVTLLFWGLLLALIATRKLRENDRFRWHWSGLSGIFILMSLDEATSIHEMANKPLHSALDTSGPLLFAWVIPGIIFLFLFAVFFFRFFLALPPRTRVLFFIAGLTYVGGVMGFELIGSDYVSNHEKDLGYGVIASVEEVLEMSGIVVFVYALLDYLEIRQTRLTFSFGN